MKKPEEKYDVIPEIWEGHNVADFVDPDIMKVIRLNYFLIAFKTWVFLIISLIAYKTWVFPPKTVPKNLDPSYKMDLDF